MCTARLLYQLHLQVIITNCLTGCWGTMTREEHT